MHVVIMAKHMYMYNVYVITKKDFLHDVNTQLCL